MSLIYRGRKFDTRNATAQTVSTAATGTYRGAAVQFRQAAKSSQANGGARQYRGISY